MRVMNTDTIKKWNSGNLTIEPLNTIQGKMITAEMKLDVNQAIQMDDLELKNRLITKLVRELMDAKCIEFTKQQDVSRMETIIRARIFATPDNEVRFMRKMDEK
jgi:kynureninase